MKKNSKEMPHQDVYVRLAPSRIHGIGVFAIRNIPRNTAVFGHDDEPFTSVPESSVKTLPTEMRRLYEDFCVLRRHRYLCPPNFNRLTVSWYLNHCEQPNVRSDESLRFVSLRRIRKGEELTADYREYSEDSFPWRRGPEVKRRDKVRRARTVAGRTNNAIEPATPRKRLRRGSSSRRWKHTGAGIGDADGH